MRTIPSTGEKIPAVGVGTNAYGVTSAEELAELRKVLQTMPELGGGSSTRRRPMARPKR